MQAGSARRNVDDEQGGFHARGFREPFPRSVPAKDIDSSSPEILLSVGIRQWRPDRIFETLPVQKVVLCILEGKVAGPPGPAKWLETPDSSKRRLRSVEKPHLARCVRSLQRTAPRYHY
jgi:hypothetical protein